MEAPRILAAHRSSYRVAGLADDTREQGTGAIWIDGQASGRQIPHTPDEETRWRART
jgi:hypothetical protein